MPELLGEKNPVYMTSESINTCLNCKRISCGGSCKNIDRVEKEKAQSKYGSAERYLIRGKKMTMLEISQELDLSYSTIARKMREMGDMREVYEYYAHRGIYKEVRSRKATSAKKRHKIV